MPGSRRIYNISGTITDGSRGQGWLDGPVEHWVQTLASWRTDPGVDAFIFWPPDVAPSTVARFATEIVPAVPDAVGET